MDALIKLVVTTACFGPDGRVLIAKRAPGTPLPELWEFPGGKMDDEDDGPEQAAARELQEELGIHWAMFERSPKLVDIIRFAAGDRWVLALFHAKLAFSGPLKPDGRSHTEHLWIQPTDFDFYEFTPGTARLIRRNVVNARARVGPLFI